MGELAAGSADPICLTPLNPRLHLRGHVGVRFADAARTYYTHESLEAHCAAVGLAAPAPSALPAEHHLHWQHPPTLLRRMPGTTSRTTPHCGARGSVNGQVLLPNPVPSFLLEYLSGSQVIDTKSNVTQVQTAGKAFPNSILQLDGHLGSRQPYWDSPDVSSSDRSSRGRTSSPLGASPLYATTTDVLRQDPPYCRSIVDAIMAADPMPDEASTRSRNACSLQPVEARLNMQGQHSAAATASTLRRRSVPRARTKRIGVGDEGNVGGPLAAARESNSFRADDLLAVWQKVGEAGIAGAGADRAPPGETNRSAMDPGGKRKLGGGSKAMTAVWPESKDSSQASSRAASPEPSRGPIDALSFLKECIPGLEDHMAKYVLKVGCLLLPQTLLSWISCRLRHLHTLVD